MKRISILGLIFVMCLVLTGCGEEKIDLSKYDKVELSKDNMYDYIDVTRIAESYDNKTTYLTYQFEGKDEGYIYKDVSFDVKIIDCYKYKLLGFDVSDNIYVNRKKVKLDKNGESDDISVTQSVDNKITGLCSGDSLLFTVENLKGSVYIPW